MYTNTFKNTSRHTRTLLTLFIEQCSVPKLVGTELQKLEGFRRQTENDDGPGCHNYSITIAQPLSQLFHQNPNLITTITFLSRPKNRHLWTKWERPFASLPYHHGDCYCTSSIKPENNLSKLHHHWCRRRKNQPVSSLNTHCRFVSKHTKAPGA